MKNKLIQQTNYNTKEIAFQLLLPLDLEVKIDTNDSVRLLIEVTERMDYSKLYSAYARAERADEASPKQMFQLVVMGFMEGIYSTRKLESACKNDIRFMYILRGKKVPDHNRFWSFIKNRLQGDVAINLFYQLVTYLNEIEEIDFTNLFVDGTKIEAQANRYSFVWKKSINKYEAKLEENLKILLRDIVSRYGMLGTEIEATECLSRLKEKSEGIDFAYGRGKRKTELQKDIETLTGYIERKAKYERYNETFKGRSSFSKTDKDATFMRMKEDHMLNGQLKPGYNLQLGVEGEYIVGAIISQERSDQLTLLPLLEDMEKHLGRKHKKIIADAGYESEENYKGLEARGQVGYIKPQNYERSKTRKYKSNAYIRENMMYDEKKDTYTCAEGKPFTYIYTTKRLSKSGYESEITVYECKGCDKCKQKKTCTRAKGNRKLTVSKEFIKQREASRERITSEEGKRLRLNRSIQSEGAFGVLKQDYGFKRFLRRGRANVFTETLLYAFAYNINKLQNKKKKKVKGVILHELSSA